MNKSTPVHKTFDAACAFRAKVPLPKGRYKLEEARSELRRIRSDVDLVAKIVLKQDAKSAKAAMATCAPEERATFLKRVPRHVAGLLGRKILPGIAALEADGVPKHRLRPLQRKAKAHGRRILTAADQVHTKLKAGIKTEYDAMRAGGSHLYKLLDDAEGLIVEALAVCPPDPSSVAHRRLRVPSSSA